jgi:hypothetical protein
VSLFEVVVGTAPGLPSDQEITLGYLPLPMKLIAFSITKPYGRVMGDASAVMWIRNPAGGLMEIGKWPTG